jgi:hypothetical protein
LAVEVVALLGDALLEVARAAYVRVAPRAAMATEWLRRAAEPPPGVELHAEDGSQYTGLVAVDRNKPIAMLAVRQAAAPRAPDRPALVTPPPSPSPYHRPLFDPELDGRWDRDGDPFRR